MQTELAKMTTISIDWSDTHQLAKSYAQFLQNGGIFIDSQELSFFQQCYVRMKLPNSHQPITIMAQVIYISAPQSKHRPRRCLLGFLFENGRNMKQYIESLLAAQ